MPAPMIVGGTFRVEKKLGEGSFGAVYLGINVVTLAEVAIKLEEKKTPAEFSTLEQEHLIYRALVDTTATPHIHWFGPTRKYNALVMDRLGRSLEDLFNQCGRKFSLKTVLMLADQMISQLEVIHTRHIIHRDIKPDNFIMGHEETRNRVFVVDFGMSKYYCNPKTRRHNKMITGKAFCGTARYASINAHLGLEQGRRDDLEAVGYVLLYFLRGGLPWQGIKIKDATERYAETGRRKLATSSSSLCSGFPKEFSTYLDLTRKLRFEDRPNYKAYRKMFMDLYAREGHMEDDTFDWTTAPKHELPAAKPTGKVKVKMKLEDALVELAQRADLVSPHEELGRVKSGLAAKERVVSKAKPVPEKPTANGPEPKTRPKVLNKIAIATKPTPTLAKCKAKAPAVNPGPAKSPPRPVTKAEPKAKLASKSNHCKIEKIPVCQSPSPSPPSPRLDMDEVLEKIEALKISDTRPPTQRDAKESNPRHLYSGNWKARAQKYTPPPPLARRTAQPGPKQAALKHQPANPVPAVKEPWSQEVTEISSDSGVAKPAKPGAVPARRLPLRMRNVNVKPPAALIHSSPQRRKNPPRLVNVTSNAKSPPRRRMVVTRAAAGRKEG